MLAQFYGLPMRRDNLRKAGRFLAASEQNLSLEKLVSVVCCKAPPLTPLPPLRAPPVIAAALTFAAVGGAPSS